MDSFAMRDVTRFRSRARRWAESRLRCRYFMDDIVRWSGSWSFRPQLEAGEAGVVGLTDCVGRDEGPELRGTMGV